MLVYDVIITTASRLTGMTQDKASIDAIENAVRAIGGSLRLSLG